ncbi:MAG: molybdenum cofactor guanylyltransferase [Lysobacteraceae bacterium]|nr:MAG: molybdenum cofactor guanylyltransferase [Xanthomonadaceae bacterium]
MEAEAFTVAILAGGAATRLGGCDKGLVLLDGRALVDHVLAAARAMSAPPPAILVIANRNLDDYAQRARALPDALPGRRGPLAGIATALAACTTPWLLSLPVDGPDPPRDLAARLLRVAQSDAACAFVAHDGERRQPLFALYRRELAASAAIAAAGGQGAARWQDRIGVREVDFRDRRRQFVNLNTPEDVAAHACADR